jgi:hypothetical protein
VLYEKGRLLDVKQGEAKEEEHGELDKVVEKKMESFIARSECFALNRNLSVEPFFDLIYDVYGAADKLGVRRIKNWHSYKTRTHTPSRVRRAKYIEGISYSRRKTWRILDKQTLVCHNNKTGTRKGKTGKRSIQVRIRTRENLEKEGRRIWMVNSRIELDEANKQIVSIRSNCGNGHTQLLSPQRLEEMVMDVYHYPGKHTQVIMLVMERHDSERQEKRSV